MNAIDAPYKKLWAAVLHQAFKDLRAKNHKRSAIAWFNNNDYDINTCYGICELLGLDKKTIEKIANKIFNQPPK